MTIEARQPSSQAAEASSWEELRNRFAATGEAADVLATRSGYVDGMVESAFR